MGLAGERLESAHFAVQAMVRNLFVRTCITESRLGNPVVDGIDIDFSNGGARSRLSSACRDFRERKKSLRAEIFENGRLAERVIGARIARATESTRGSGKDGTIQRGFATGMACLISFACCKCCLFNAD